MDPIFILGLGVVGFASAGWLMGPFVGDAAWKLVHRRNRAAFAAVCGLLFFCPSFACSVGDMLIVRRAYRKTRICTTG